MGLGIINSLDFKAGNYKVYSMNAYFPPASGGTSPAAHHTRITNYQHRLEMPHYAKRQKPNDFARSPTQKHIRQKLLDGYFAVLSGDLNDSPDTYSFNMFMTANQLTNPLQATFGHDLLFYTRDANSSKMKNTTINHAMHTPLPDNIALQQVGVCNVKTYENYNDYGDHLPVWANFKLTTPIVFVQPRNHFQLTSAVTLAVSLKRQDKIKKVKLERACDLQQAHHGTVALFPKHTLKNHG
jgi:hypothetical protein